MKKTLAVIAALFAGFAEAAIPDAYEQLDAAVFDDAAYVDTGLVVAGAQISVRFQLPYVSDRHLFGQSVGGKYTHFTAYNNKWYWGVNGSEGNSGTLAWSEGIHELVFSELGSGRIVLDGQEIAADVLGHSTGGKNLLVGSRSNNHNFKGSIYSFAVTNQNGSAVLDYVPARRKSDGLVGFYDRVTGAFKAPVRRIDGSAAEAVEFIEYAHFPKGAFVDLGRAFTNVQITAKWFSDAYTADAHLFGSPSGGKYLHFTSYNNKWYWGTKNAESNSGSIAWTGGLHELTFAKNGTETGDVVLDGVTLGGHAIDNSSLANLALGSRNQPLSVQTYFEGDIYSFAVTNRTGAEVMNLRPCRRLEDGQIGFYDRVSDCFLGSQGAPLVASDAIAGYTFIEAVEFSSGTYVDTGMAVDGVEVTADFDMPTFISDSHVFGSIAGGKWLHFTSYNNKWYWGVKNSEGNSGTTSWSAGRHVVVYNKNCEGSVTLDGTSIGSGVSTGTTSGSKLYIGLRNSVANFAGKIYSFAVTNSSGRGIMDLRPCMRKSDRVVGFYDNVRKIFIACSGKGSMSDAYEPVDYIPFNVKGAYLDTGVAVNDDQVSVTFSEPAYQNDAHVLGQDGSSRWGHFTAYNNKWYWATNGNDEVNSGAVAWSGGTHRLTLNKVDTGDVILDGTVIGVAKGFCSWNGNLLVGSRSKTANFIGNVYSVAVTNKSSGFAVLDLVPSVRKSDSRYGFFDRVRGQFLTSPLLGYRSDSPVRPPKAFTRLSYLRTNGAWFDTRLFPSDKLRTVSEYRSSDTSLDKCLFGARNSGYGYLCWIGSSGGLYCGPVIQNSALVGGEFTTVSGVRHTLDMSVSSAKVDGVELFKTLPTATDAVSSTPLLLFAINDKSGTTEFVSGRRFVGDSYGFKAYEGETCVRDLVPVRRESDGCVGFFDFVSKVFFAPHSGNVCAEGPAYGTGVMIIVR